MIDTNSVAYWPSMPDCNNLCVEVTVGATTLPLLHIDQSGGAFDISYNAWNILYTGQNASVNPQEGGGIDATYAPVDMSVCVDAGLIKAPDGKLPLMAANSMDFVASCLADPTSWVAGHYGLWNIATSTCTYGVDEECSLDLEVSNQPACPSQLGLQTPLDSMPVYNVQYGTGLEVLATS